MIDVRERPGVPTAPTAPANARHPSAAPVLAETTFAAFLFTDVEGSTALWQAHPQAMHAAMAAHDAIVRAAIARHAGRVVKGTGDGFHAAFDRGEDAVRALLDAQSRLAEPDATAGFALRVRGGVHMGECWARDADYYGPEVNRAARVMDAAHGGQMLVSEPVARRVEKNLPEGVELRDLGRVRLRDLQRAQHLYQVVAPHLRAEFPPLRSLDSTPNNLVPQSNSFVGRERELAELRVRIGEGRLVTLLGAGGIGKTRLSQQLAATMLDSFADGVWLVDLAPVSQPHMVAQTLASVLGVREQGGAPVQEALDAYLRHREVLVVLDNCEHLIDACAAVARQLLEAGPGVKVLASSREVLRLSGEHVFHVPSLAVADPAGDDGDDGDGGPMPGRADAVHLFFDRARAAQPTLVVDEATTRAAARICHHLDGLPLAIELAAARTRALSAQAIAERILDRFCLLGRADRTHLPRQQTLRALIDWSYDLLPEDERLLLRRLSVFVGGWTLGACEAVCVGEGIEQDAVVDLLTALVEKSLVVLDLERERYRLLDTVRHYARDRLDESGPAAIAVRDRHGDHYVGFAETARPQIVGPQQGTWLAMLDADRNNLVAAHAWSLESQDDGDGALRLSYALRPYWIDRGRPALGLQLTREALDRARKRPRDVSLCRAYFDAGSLSYVMGRFAEARASFSECLFVAQEIGDARWMAGVLQLLGMACLGEGDEEAADRHLVQGLLLARERGDKRELSGACNALAQLRHTQQRFDEAAVLFGEVLALARELGDRDTVAIGLLNLSMVFIQQRRAMQARPLLLEALTIDDETGSVRLALSALEVGCGLAQGLNDPARAAHWYGCAEAQAKRTGLVRDPSDAAFLEPLVESARQELGQEAFDRARVEGDRQPFKAALADLRAWLEA